MNTPHSEHIFNQIQCSVVQYQPDSDIMQGWTALHYAAAFDCPRAMQLLVSAGADVNAQDTKVR